MRGQTSREIPFNLPSVDELFADQEGRDGALLDMGKGGLELLCGENEREVPTRETQLDR